MNNLAPMGSVNDLLAPERREDLAVLLLKYATERRWFRSKARARRSATIDDILPVSAGGEEGFCFIALLRIEYREGAPETYVLPVAVVSDARAAEIQQASPHAVIGSLGMEQSSLVDGLATEELASTLLQSIREGRVLKGEAGEIVGAPLDWLNTFPAAEGITPRLSSAEQTNTSIFFGDVLFLKVFRAVEEGPNADYEISRFLTERRGFTGSGRVAGGLEYRRSGRAPATLGMLQEFVKNQGDAWSFTLSQLDSFLDRALSSGAVRGGPPSMPTGSPFDWAGQEPPAPIHDLAGHFLPLARKLGERTAELHKALADGGGEAAFEPEPLTRADRESLVRGAETLLTRNFGMLRRHEGRIPGGARQLVAELLGREGEVRSKLTAVAEGGEGALRTRCHGDYHLGQVLFTGSDFLIIDFEGEPGRPLAERREKSSPMRDVAGMLRSFHYAGAAAIRSAQLGAADARDLEPWAEAWTAWASAAYMAGYMSVAGDAAFIPKSTDDARRLLEFFILDKCVYEIGYELNNRPDWIEIPLRGLARLVGPAFVPEPAMVGAKKGGPLVIQGGASPIGDLDLHLFHEGSHMRIYEKLGARPAVKDGVPGVFFAVWAPNADRVAIIGEFNQWDTGKNLLTPHGGFGVWEGFVEGAKIGDIYKIHIVSRVGGYRVDKADPFGFRHQEAPEKASVVWHLDYTWGDDAWMKSRGAKNANDAPMATYEVHLGSWARGEDNKLLSYREIAPKLAEYVKRLGFTHVELLPLSEHPFYGSWGYETTGYFGATSRYGTPQDLMFLIDTLHQAGIGVIIDWVPGHFPTDEHGLGFFDGTHLYEHEDVRQGLHKDWNTFIFNYGRHEVRSFLLSSAIFWLEEFHADGLRVDGVASMLYLDYGRNAGEWIPNVYGGRENLEAVSFLRQVNEAVRREHPDVQMIAEESTAWPMVTRPAPVGGLGFGMKWDMGWMHDTLSYFAKDPIHRRFHHNQLTFRGMYAFSENFVMPLSHDEVVHGKGSLINKMSGDLWRKFANLRLLFTYMWAQPGKKLVFMGGEIAQWREWNHDRSLDWDLLNEPNHRGIQHLVGELNRLYREEPSLHELDFDPRGFVWIDANDSEHSVLSFERRAKNERDSIVVVFNLTPLPRLNYRVGVPRGGAWTEILNTDAESFGGAGYGNLGEVEATPVRWHGRDWSVNLTLPPLGAVFLKPRRTRKT
ncbi:MAG TPA: 1,4-alpha-glucan branching protein GlgB [Polyangiaceae bacterium]|nr:1,4-alpha-glucan branching protein GlgB [Polyangiaceae bacterium]